jgi:cyclin-dependent kinase regulatory subunit CKS1
MLPPCRHVILPKELSKQIPRDRLLNEQEWRQMGVQQSRGWMHYAIHRCVRHRCRRQPRRATPTHRLTHSTTCLCLPLPAASPTTTRRSPEPHILLFRRPLGTDPVTGKVVVALANEAAAKYREEMGIESGR